MKIGRILFLTVSCLFSCGEDFVYHNKDIVARKIIETVNVKTIEGNDSINILFVIDNSPSMHQEQQDVITNANNFIRLFSKTVYIPWKIGLISTDEKDPPYIGFSTSLDSNDANPVLKFQQAVGRLGIGGSGIEKVFDNVIQALNNYPSFLTPRSFFAVIAITDAEDQSKILPKNFIAEIHRLRNSTDAFKYYGALAARDLGCKSHDGYTKYMGGRHEKVITFTKGTVYTLCTQDFGNLLAKIGENILKDFYRSRILLEVRPDTSTMVVAYRGNVLMPGPQSQGGEWYYDYDTNAIVFYSLDFATNAKEDVDISYTEKLIYEQPR